MNGHRNAEIAPSSYGRDLGKKMGAEDAPAIVTRSIRGTEIAITEIRVDRPLGRRSDPIPREDATMISVTLLELPTIEYWEEGRQVGEYSLQRGGTTLHDLRREPLALIDKPVHSLLFYLPRAAIDALADELNVRRIDELDFRRGAPVMDETMLHLGLSLMPVFRTPENAFHLFTDHVALALTSHVARTYGGLAIAPKFTKGGLAPWQERRAKEMLTSDLAGAKRLNDIAKACGLSVSYFSRAFRRSTGLAPHAWLLRARVERAKAMLRAKDASLSAVALACGFADHSHLTRVFTRQVGLGPGAWRRLMVD